MGLGLDEVRVMGLVRVRDWVMDSSQDSGQSSGQGIGSDYS